MKGRDILQALSFIDEKYVDEAEHGRFQHRKWVRFAAMAASLSVIITAASWIHRESSPMESESTGVEETLPESMDEAYEAAEGGLNLPAGSNAPLVVTVEKWLDNGFLGIVVDSAGDFTTGTVLEIRPGEGSQWEIQDGDAVLVRDYYYDPEENVIYAGWIGKDE